MGRIGVLSGVTFVGLISAANLDKIEADVREGGRRDAILYAVGGRPSWAATTSRASGKLQPCRCM
jgi:hypothetical protein